MKTAKKEMESLTTAREPRPFLHIQPDPRIELPTTASEGLFELEEMVSADVPGLVKALVGYTLSAQNRLNMWAGRRVPPSVSTINRRRRAARQWIQSILAGSVDEQTLRSVGHAWIPQLAGSGPDLHEGSADGFACIEYIRGSVTSRIFDREAESLVPQAKALHAFESILAVHLAAYQRAVQASRKATQGA